MTEWSESEVIERLVGDTKILLSQANTEATDEVIEEMVRAALKDIPSLVSHRIFRGFHKRKDPTQR
jgi:hypothetical protein